MSRPGPVLDLELVRAEITEMAAGWRERPDLGRAEAEILATLRRDVPGSSADGAGLLDQVERLAAIAPFPPSTPGRRSVVLAKKAVRRVTSGPFHHLADQTSALGHTLAAALRALDGRSAALERRMVPELDLPPHPVLPPDVVSFVADRLQGVPTAVHVEAGDGAMVAALGAAGIAAWGVEPVVTRVAAARRRGLDLRRGEAVRALASLPPRSVGAVLLSGGVVDTAPTGAVVEAARAAVNAAADVLVVVTQDREALAAAQPVLADLGGGRPLLPATWVFLLEQFGWAEVDVVDVDGLPGTVLVARRSPPA